MGSGVSVALGYCSPLERALDEYMPRVEDE
jgi:hypothetical protein